MLLAPTVVAADLTITDCRVDAACRAVGAKTVIQAPNDRVIVAAPIEPVPGTRVIRIEAREIEVTEAGGITADGKGKAIALLADTIVTVRGPLRATNPNGDIVVETGGALTVLGPDQGFPPGAMLTAGDRVRLACDEPACVVSIGRASLNARRIYVEADGDLQLCDNLFTTSSPRDLIKLTSHEGSIIQAPPSTATMTARQASLSGDRGAAIDWLHLLFESCHCEDVTGCGDGILTGVETCDDASLAGGDPVFQPGAPPGRICRRPEHPSDPCTFCGDGLLQTGEDCDDGNAVAGDGCSNECKARVCENEFRGGVESAMFATAAKDIAMAGVRLHIEIAENIELTAGEMIDLTNAVVSNLHGKPGEIEIEAGRGSGLVTIGGATLLDDQKGGQAPDVSEINGREQLPHTGHNNVVGVPAMDD